VVDSHMHFWNAAPDNWVPGAEQYAKGWIECFHAYQGLGPAQTHWPLDKAKNRFAGICSDLGLDVPEELKQ